jgi:hypothetical protein
VAIDELFNIGLNPCVSGFGRSLVSAHFSILERKVVAAANRLHRTLVFVVARQTHTKV